MILSRVTESPLLCRCTSAIQTGAGGNWKHSVRCIFTVVEGYWQLEKNKIYQYKFLLLLRTMQGLPIEPLSVRAPVD